jgi:hypothetical protein
MLAPTLGVQIPPKTPASFVIVISSVIVLVGEWVALVRCKSIHRSGLVFVIHQDAAIDGVYDETPDHDG